MILIALVWGAAEWATLGRHCRQNSSAKWAAELDTLKDLVSCQEGTAEIVAPPHSIRQSPKDRPLDFISSAESLQWCDVIWLQQNFAELIPEIRCAPRIPSGS